MLIAGVHVLALGRLPSSPVAERARASASLLALCVGGCKFGVTWETPAVVDAATEAAIAIDAAPPMLDAPPADAFAGATRRVNIAGPAYTGVDHPGSWAADAGVCPGAAQLAVTVPINATVDDVLFRSAAVADALHCTLGGVPSGTYEVTLLFAEIDRGAACAAGSRVFSIDVEGTIMAMGFDLALEGGGCALAGDSGYPVVKTYAAVVTDGALDVWLTASASQPALLAAVQAVQTGP